MLYLNENVDFWNDFVWKFFIVSSCMDLCDCGRSTWVGSDGFIMLSNEVMVSLCCPTPCDVLRLTPCDLFINIICFEKFVFILLRRIKQIPNIDLYVMVLSMDRINIIEGNFILLMIYEVLNGDAFYLAGSPLFF